MTQIDKSEILFLFDVTKMVNVSTSDPEQTMNNHPHLIICVICG
jgi:hypothetical protein